MKLQTEPFNNIANGKKIIESRLYDEKRQQINIDDQIKFTDTNNQSRQIITTVEALHRYRNFKELFSDFLPKYFGGKSKQELLKEINSFYSEDDQKKYGVMGIKIKLIKNSPAN